MQQSPSPPRAWGVMPVSILQVVPTTTPCSAHAVLGWCGGCGGSAVQQPALRMAPVPSNQQCMPSSRS